MKSPLTRNLACASIAEVLDFRCVAVVEVRTRYWGRDVWVHPNLLGRTYEFERDGRAVTLRLPREPSDFQPSEDDQQTPRMPACLPMSAAQELGEAFQVVAVRLFRVDVRYGADISTELPDPMTADYANSAEAVWNEGALIADAVAHDFLRWLRSSSRQEWLGLIAETPRQYGRSGLFDAITGAGIMGFGPQETHTFRLAMLAFTPDAFDAMMACVAAGDEVPVA
jgi:hypothetical protein